MYLEILKNECLEIVFKSVLKFKSQINFNLSNCKILSLLNKKKNGNFWMKDILKAIINLNLRFQK